ncbi:Protein-lysine N-methyltransferase rrg1 [Fusarium oxysporum f. sp. albedinis]|nr:Protein-lysine N-methyltransferase rrg1 [Fusarium oxysporum f. sp. albedinis]
MWESQTKQSTLENQIPSNAREIHVNPFFLLSFPPPRFHGFRSPFPSSSSRGSRSATAAVQGVGLILPSNRSDPQSSSW